MCKWAEAYHLREQGLLWREITKAIGETTISWVYSRTQHWAEKNGKPWPLDRTGKPTGDGLTRLQRKLEFRRKREVVRKAREEAREAKMAERAKAKEASKAAEDPRKNAYLDRARTGKHWGLAIFDHGVGGGLKAIQAFAEEEQLPWPVPLAGKTVNHLEGDALWSAAYHCLRMGLTYEVVSRLFGFHVQHLQRKVRHLAKRHNLKWPLQSWRVQKGTPSPLGKKAFDLRLETGMKWTEIGKIINRKNPSSLAMKHAIRFGLQWPIVTKRKREQRALKHEACLLARGCGPDWEKIGRRLGITPSQAASYAREHADIAGVDIPCPQSKGEYLYRERERGKTWETIQKEVGYKHLHHVIGHAKRWALKTGALWPPLPGDRGLYCFCERVLTGDHWRDIADRLGLNPDYRNGFNAHQYARRFTERNPGVPWPIPESGTWDDLTIEDLYLFREAGIPRPVLLKMLGQENTRTNQYTLGYRLRCHAETHGLQWPLPHKYLYRGRDRGAGFADTSHPFRKGGSKK